MKFLEYIKNKRIAVVGPAGYTTKFNNKDLIESYDIVIRFNAALPVHPEMVGHIGTRTDILSNCLDGEKPSCGAYNSVLWKEQGVKWVFCPYWPRWEKYTMCSKIKFEKHNNGLLDVYYNDKETFFKVKNALRTRPNSGVLTVMFLLQHNVREIFLTGFSFGVGLYDHHVGYKDYIPSKDRSSINHDQSEQLIYFKEQFKIHKNIIKTDEYLHSILK